MIIKKKKKKLVAFEIFTSAMPGNRKRKSRFQKVQFMLPVDVLNHTEGEGEVLHERVCQIIQAPTAVEQMQFLEKLQEDACSSENTKTLPLLLDIACRMYFQTPAEVPLKRNFLRLFEVTSQKDKVMVASIMKKVFKDVVDTEKKCCISSATKIFNAVHSLQAVPFGKELLMDEICSVCEYLSASFLSLLSLVRSGCSPQEATELYHCCLLVLKTSRTVFQNLGEYYEKTEKDNSLSAHIVDIISSVTMFLIEDHILPLCRLNAAMVLSVALKIDNEFDLMGYILHHELNQSMIILPSLEKLPVISQVILLHGIMSSDCFVRISFHKNASLVFEKVLNELMTTSRRNEGPLITLHCARAVLQWTVAMKTVVSAASDKAVELLFGEGSPVLNSLVQYVISSMDHFTDNLNSIVQEVFENILCLHLHFLHCDIKESGFLQNISHILLEMPWHVRGKYPLLSKLGKFLGASFLLEQRPELARDLYSAFEDHSLFSHVSELCHQLYQKSSHEVDAPVFERLWVKPLWDVLQHGPTLQRYPMVQHILPKLLVVSPASAEYLMSQAVQPSSAYVDVNFEILVKCLKYTQVDVHFDRDYCASSYCFYLPPELIELALGHGSNQVRLAAYSLICDIRSSTKIITCVEFSAVRKSLPWNICCQCAAFRQQFLSMMKKFFLRMRESCKFLQRKSREDFFQEVFDNYKDFFEWLCSYLHLSLHPGANFSRRLSALNLIHLLHETFQYAFITEHSTSVFGMVSLSSQLSTAISLQTVLEVLKDSYENNKQLALSILKHMPQDMLFCQGRDVHHLVQVAAKLLYSSRPTDSITASYIMCLLSNYSITLEDMEPTLCMLKEEKQCIVMLVPSVHLQYHSVFVILELLIGILSHQVVIAKQSLLEAAACSPMYGVLTCVRYVLTDVQFMSITDYRSLSLWQILLKTLVTLCFEAVKIVEPTVCHMSPEGHLPVISDQDSMSETHLAPQSSSRCCSKLSVVENSSSTSTFSDFLVDVKSKAVAAQMLLLCSWRTHKEISLLFGMLAEAVLWDDATSENSFPVLAAKEFYKIGQFFIRQLSEVKHRGAFEQAYVGFYKLCHRMWRTKNPDLHTLPPKWLKDVLCLVSGKVSPYRLCANRRSAGLPYMLQALLVSEPEIRQSEMFSVTINSLLTMAQSASNQFSDSQVHAMNILRAMYRDSLLGEIVIPYISDGLKAAVLGFKSEFWIVRNASTLLFSALITRIFGVNRSREEIQRKNCLPGHVFFSRFSEMFEFLHNEFSLAVNSLKFSSGQKRVSFESSLHPMLLLLGRLYASPLDECNSVMSLSCFVPLVMKCAASRSWKTRMLSSKALLQLVSIQNVDYITGSLFSALPRATEQVRHNELHGVLLQIASILKGIQHKHMSASETLLKKLPLWIHSHIDVCMRSNNSLSARALFMEILCRSLSLNVQLDVHCIEKVTCEVMYAISCPSKCVGQEEYLVKGVMFLLSCFLCIPLEQQSTSTVLHAPEKAFQKSVIYFLSSPHYEVRLGTLIFFLYLLNIDNSFINSRCEFPFTSFISSTVPWNQAVEKNKTLLELTVKSMTGYFNSVFVATENHSGCLAKAYLLLSIIQRSVCDHCPFAATERLSQTVSKLHQTTKEDLSSALLLYAGNLTASLCNTLVCTSQTSCSKLRNLAFIEESIDKFCLEVENSASPDCSLERRQVVVCTLNDLKGVLQGRIYEIIGTRLSGLWQALFLLLIDDEPSIKDAASEIVEFFKQHHRGDGTPKRTHTTAPVKALDDFFGIFLSSFSSPSSSSYCLSALLEWMLLSSSGTDGLDVMDDELPFNKGEMNVFAEDFTVLHVANRHLEIFLSAHRKPQDILIKWKPSCALEMSENSQVEKFCSLDQVAFCCARDLHHITDEFQYCAFLNKQFEKQLLKIAQYVYVLSSLWPFVQPVNSVTLKSVNFVLNHFRSISCKNSILDHIQTRLEKCN